MTTPASNSTGKLPAGFDAQLLDAQQDLLWLVLGDPMVIIVLVTLVVMLAIAAIQHVRTRRHLGRHTSFLDHQQATSTRAVELNADFYDRIQEQYAESNRRADAALAQGAQALQLHQQAVEELRRLNEVIADLSRQVDGKSAR